MLYLVTFTLTFLASYFYVSCGNRKLKSGKTVKFLIFNLPAIITCPFATELCKKFCYARKAEKFRTKTCLPSRMKNLEFTKSDLFVKYMIQFISIKLNHLKPGVKIFFRIHESGDFYNIFYARKWLEIMRYFENDDRIRFMAYTKSVRYFENETLPKNFSLRFSIWSDTRPEEIEIAKKMGLPIYTAATKEQLAKMDPKTYFYCDCIDCGSCQACYYNGHKMIICLIH